MKPNHSVPLTVASGFAAPLPGVPVRALISTRAITMRVRAQNIAPELGMGKGRWLAEPMKKSMGMEKATLVREASPPRAPAAAAAGFAGLAPRATAAVLDDDFVLGQDHQPE